MKRLVPIKCGCKRKRSRQKYGVNACDVFSFEYHVAHIFANALFLYIDKAKKCIEREDWDILEQHAKAIRDFAEADAWEELSKEDDIKNAYLKKHKAFKEAMNWLGEHWKGLWF